METNPIDLWVQKYCSAASEKEIKNALDWIVGDEIFGKISELTKLQEKVAPRLSEKSTVCSILNELDRRWRLFAQSVAKAKGADEIRPDGLARLIQKRIPDMFAVWMSARQQRNLPPL